MKNVKSVYGSDAVAVNFGFVDSVPVILMSKIDHALQDKLSRMQKNLIDWISIYELLLKRSKIDLCISEVNGY